MSIANNKQQIKLNLENQLKNQLNKQIETTSLEMNDANISKNGTHSKLVHTIAGTIQIKVPRLRNHKFEYELLELNMFTDSLRRLCIEMYGNGLSTYRISEVLLKSFGLKVSKSKVSDYCKTLSRNVYDYFNTELMNHNFKVIHIDGKYYRVKEINTNRKAVLLNAIGITDEGRKVHLHMDVKPTEDKQYVEEFLNFLKGRIRDTNACFVIDGKNNLPTTINKIFPNAKVQRCLVHVSRNIESSLKNVTTLTEAKAIISEVNNLLFNTVAKDIKQNLALFISKHPRYNYIFKQQLQSEYIWTWTKLNTFEDCKTNNNIEGFHSMLESVTSQHNCFETSELLYRAIIREIERYNELDSLATSQIKSTGLNFDIKEILKVQKLEDQIKLLITYNGRKRISSNMSKTIYDEIRLLLTG